jgi:hypothetical protein
VIIEIIMRLLSKINALNDGSASSSVFLNSTTAGRSLMKFGVDFVPLEATLSSHFLI